MISIRMVRLSGLIFIMMCMLSCERGEKSIGGQFLNQEGRLSLVDTFSVNLSTFTSDSVVTSGQKIALAGITNDPVFGKTTSKSYMVFGFPSVSQVSDDAVLDSLVLALTYTGYYYGDTLQKLNLGVHRLTEAVELDENTEALYNSSSFSYESEPLGSISLFPRPASIDKITIQISNQLGNDFLDIFKKNSDKVKDDESFIEFFKGIVLVPSSAGSIVGFDVNDTTLFLKLYYHIPSELGQDSKEIEFIPSTTSIQFNQITTSRANTPISKLGIAPTSANATGNCSFVQGCTSVITRVDIPFLNDFIQSHKNLEILRADLVIQPTLGQKVDDLPENFSIYYSNSHCEFVKELTSTSGATLDGNLQIDYVFPENTTYTWDVTSYVKQVISDNATKIEGLLIVPNDYHTTFDRVMFSNQTKSSYRTKLKLYTASYE